MDTECDQKHPLSDPPTIVENTSRRRAHLLLARQRQLSYWILYNGLSETAQLFVRACQDLGEIFVDPKPKILYERIKALYGARIGTGFFYNFLWREVYRMDIAENEDPNPKLDMMVKKWRQLIAGGASPEVKAHIRGLAPYAILNTLPVSYRSMVMVLENDTSVTMEKVLWRVRQEARRRDEAGLVVGPGGTMIQRPTGEGKTRGSRRRNRRGRG